MKKHHKSIVLVVLLFASLGAQAQFEAGQSFISGNFSTNFNRAKYDDTQPAQGLFSYNVGASWGTFTQKNKALGWGLSHSLTSQKFNSGNENIPSLKNVSFGGSRFVEFYKPVFDKVALYISPSVGLTYRLENSVDQQGGAGTYRVNQDNTLSLGASLSGGIAWRFTPKWSLYGNFAFTNPISISGGVSTSKQYSANVPSTEPVEARGGVFSYNFSPGLSSGYVGLGFRYFYTRN